MIKLRQFNRKIFLIIIIVFIFIAANFNLSKNIAGNFSITKKFPENINGWTGHDCQVEKTNKIFTIIPSKDIVLRLYKKAGLDGINMALILADDKKRIHDPQICYKLQGFRFLDKQKIQLAPNLKVNFIKSQKKSRKYSFIYWYTDLDANYTTRTEFWRKIAFKKIFGKPIKTYGIVILYTPVENQKNLKKFSQEVNNILFTKIKNQNSF